MQVRRNMDVMEAILSRRSIRQFSRDKVDADKISQILEGGRWAPSGLNNQPWKFLLVEGEKKNVLASHTKYVHVIEEARVCIVVFLDKEASYDYVKDVQAIGACIQNMLLAAHELGLCAVWLGEIRNQAESVVQEFGCAKDMELMAVVAVGHPRLPAGDSDRKAVSKLLIN